MEKEAFAVLKGLEGTWWQEGRSAAIRSALHVVGVSHVDTVLDVGAGYGSMFSVLSTYGKVDATEPNTEAAQECLRRGYSSFFPSEKDAIAASKQYGIIGAFDVIEHVENDAAFVSNLYTLTEKGGVLVATVPAFQWLWSEHDVTHRHFRRHTAASMKKLLHNAGYEIVYVRYWNTFLFPLVLLARLLGSSGESGLHLHRAVNAILIELLKCEALMQRFLPIPFGLSVVIVGRKG